MDLDECYKKGLIKRTRIDVNLIRSLIEISNINEQTVSNADVNKINISSYVSLAYDSLREILESICISKGYKVLSHICIGELLKTLINDFDYNNFDRVRYIRNGINYYGVQVDFEQGMQVIRNIFNMKKLLFNKHLKDKMTQI